MCILEVIKRVDSEVKFIKIKDFKMFDFNLLELRFFNFRYLILISVPRLIGI